MTVKCEDSGDPAKNTSASFLVEVTDENDSEPVFDTTYYSAHVTEGPNDRWAVIFIISMSLDSF